VNGSARLEVVGAEVLVARESRLSLSDADLDVLKRRAAAAPRGRIRICAHAHDDAAIHEMLIVHPRNAYVRPHKHLGKSESLLVVEGSATAVFFDDDGRVADRVALGPPGSGRTFYYRVDEPVFHSLLITSDVFVFQETTAGPFRREDTVFAPWAPADEGPEAERFVRDLLATSETG
jgi:cupin fold WbuC family metalloprotein